MTYKQAMALYGNSTRALAIALGVDDSTVHRWRRRTGPIPHEHALTLLYHPVHRERAGPYAAEREAAQRMLAEQHDEAMHWLKREDPETWAKLDARNKDAPPPADV